MTGDGRPIVRPAADAGSLGMAFVAETRPDGARRIVFAGPRCLALNGVTGEQLAADPDLLFDMILPEHRAAFAAAVDEAQAKLEPFDVEVAMRRPDGEVRWHRFAALPRPQPDGGVLWDGLQIDVTDMRRMTATLAEQHHRLEMAAEVTGLGYWEWDVETDTLIWSERNRLMLGVGLDEPVSVARYWELVHPEDVEAVRAAFAGASERPAGGDYSVEHRVITPAGETRWILTYGRVSTDVTGHARLVVGANLDITDRRAAEDQRDLLMGELAHRSKNRIAVTMALVSQTARGQPSVEAYRDVLMGRLQAMANAQDLVTAAAGQPVPLTGVIAQALAPFGRQRFDLDPALEQLTMRSDLALGMGLLLYEMATNAVKHGALSSNRGRVRINMEPAAEHRAAFSWREQGGPPVAPAGHEGFGTRLTRQALRDQGGEVEIEFAPKGFRARVEFPTADWPSAGRRP
jgi:PAS domain S-box-containing protein